ncbi:hypothetical protein D3C80_2029180 [compost metagenome]
MVGVVQADAEDLARAWHGRQQRHLVEGEVRRLDLRQAPQWLLPQVPFADQPDHVARRGGKMVGDADDAVACQQADAH